MASAASGASFCSACATAGAMQSLTRMGSSQMWGSTPELLQGEVKASSVLEAVLRYLKDTTKVHNDLAKARSKMGDRGAYKFWADVIAKTVGR